MLISDIFIELDLHPWSWAVHYAYLTQGKSVLHSEVTKKSLVHGGTSLHKSIIDCLLWFPRVPCLS